MADALGYACCSHCGAEYRLFTIFNRDMQALCNGWKRRHERGCKIRTPDQRRRRAKPYIGKDRLYSSIVVDMNHPGFQDTSVEPECNFETWFDNLTALVVAKTGIEFRDADSVREDYESGKNFADLAEEIAAEYNHE